MKIFCCICGKQAVHGRATPNDEYVTTLEGARAGFRQDECFCGHCAKDLDENGLFPEEAAQVID